MSSVFGGRNAIQHADALIASAGSHGRIPTIGYLTPRIGDNVSQALWAGVVDAAQEFGAHLICFAGEILRDADGLSSPANVAYSLASAEIVDGLVSWASSVGGTLEPAKVASFHDRYYPLPMVSITLPMEGIPTVSIDSYQGMRDMIAHLVEVHGYRRLSFIRGPESHYYAQERYRAYSDALQAYGIAPDPDLVTMPGSFGLATGAEGIRLLLDERGLRPQVDCGMNSVARPGRSWMPWWPTVSRSGPRPRGCCGTEPITPIKAGALRPISFAVTISSWRLCWLRKEGHPTFGGPRRKHHEERAAGQDRTAGLQDWTFGSCQPGNGARSSASGRRWAFVSAGAAATASPAPRACASRC